MNAATNLPMADAIVHEALALHAAGQEITTAAIALRLGMPLVVVNAHWRQGAQNLVIAIMTRRKGAVTWV